MPKGLTLWRDQPRWEEGGGFLLLNPRWPPARLRQIREAEFPDLSDHVWIASSGTAGKVKVVALSRAALHASAQAVNTHLRSSVSDVWINPLPLFHVGGLGINIRAALSGAKVVFFPAWDARGFVEAAQSAGASLASLVPAQVHDLVQARLAAPPSLRAVVVGGAAIPDRLLTAARELGWPLLPSYGLTEAGSQVATARWEEDEATSLPLLSHVETRLGADGVLELRGASLLSGWLVFEPEGSHVWEDPRRGGWYRTGDRAELKGRNVRVLGRVDDLVKIRGELVDLAALERDLQARVTSGAVMLRCVPDERNGLALQVTAENEVAVAEVRQAQDEVFPPYARPQEITMGRIERTALGKAVRS